MPTALAAWRRWQAAAGPWRGWAVCPALAVSTRISEREGGEPTTILDHMREGAELATILQGEGAALVLDIDPVDGVALAAEASRTGLAHAVLVLPRWPHACAVLPCDELVAALVAASRLLRGRVRTSNVVFVLDGDRRTSIVPRSQGDPRIDNRYEIAATDLPDLATLRRAGIQRIVRLTRAA